MVGGYPQLLLDAALGCCWHIVLHTSSAEAYGTLFACCARMQTLCMSCCLSFCPLCALCPATAVTGTRMPAKSCCVKTRLYGVRC